jgi:hypothetical protein
MKNTHIPYAVITAIAMIILAVILYITNMTFTAGWAKYILFIPFLAGLILNAMAFSKANDHYVTFGNVFTSGFRATAIITLIMIAWSFISLAIFPDIVPKGLEVARQELLHRGFTDDQIDKQMEFTKSHFKLFMIMGGIFGYVIEGVIFSLIAAIFPQKKGDNPFRDAQKG